MNNNIKRYASEDYVDEKVVQSDWNQNDPTAPDFVKNRPFWTGGIVENVLFDGNIASEGEISVSLTAGGKYICTLDGIEYILTAQQIGNSLIYIGSESLVNEEEYIDTEPPFCIITWYENGWNNFFYTINEGEEHSLEIVAETEEIQTIPEKYIPESIAREDKYNSGNLKAIQLVNFVNFGLALFEYTGERTEPLSIEDWKFAKEVSAEVNAGNYMAFYFSDKIDYMINYGNIDYDDYAEINVGCSRIECDTQNKINICYYKTTLRYDKESETVTATYTRIANTLN